MVFLDINTKNYEEKDETGRSNIDILNQIIDSNHTNKVFILYYMEGCGPCNATKPEWAKLKNVFIKHKNKNDIAIVEIDQVLSSKIKSLKEIPSSFPTIRMITNKGNTIEDYEDSKVQEKNRTIDSFVEWINLNTKNKQDGGKSVKKYNYKKSKNHKNYKNKTKKGGKWSLKYKRSINCRKPKGFSQKQYCKYSRKR
jgi:thiol-disulfide isomerase/thioredoxin